MTKKPENHPGEKRFMTKKPENHPREKRSILQKLGALLGVIACLIGLFYFILMLTRCFRKTEYRRDSFGPDAAALSGRREKSRLTSGEKKHRIGAAAPGREKNISKREREES